MREFVIWSKFGLWRTVTEQELQTGGVVEAAWEDMEADLDGRGFALTFCDVEPVAVLPGYPDEEPVEVLAWFAENAPGWEADD
jgi:hypothetical protein